MAGLFSKFFGSGVSTAVGISIGGPAGGVLEPAIQSIRNLAWNKHQSMPLEAVLLAAGVAQGQVAADWAADEATLTGINAGRFAKLVAVFDSGPGTAEAFRLWRRGLIDDDGFKRALKREAIEQEWIDEIVKTKTERLSPAEVAAGIQQGHLPNPGILPNVSPAVVIAEGAAVPLTPDGQPPSNVPLTQVDLNVLTELAAHGIDLPRAQVIANLAGLPPGVAELLQLWNRGELDEQSVDAGLREGHLKTKWSGAVKRLRWAVLGAAEYASAHLRGWIDQETMYRGGALTGHTKSQMDLLYLNRGRPIAPQQAFDAIARAAPGPTGLGYERGPHPFDYEDFDRAIRQSDIRTEYTPTLHGLYFHYPPLFQLGRAAQAGALLEPRVREIMHIERYEPQDIDSFCNFWYRAGGAVKQDPWLAKAEQRFWTDAQNAFVKDGQLRSVIEPLLAVIVPDLATRDAIFQWWTDARTAHGAPAPGS